MVRKGLSLLLALFLTCTAIGCVNVENGGNTQSNTEAPTETKAAAPTIQKKALSADSKTVIGKKAEFTFQAAFVMSELAAPIKSSYYRSYSASAGSVWLVFSADVKNMSGSSSSLTNLLTCKIQLSGSEQALPSAMTYCLKDGGSEMDTSPSIGALETKRVYYAFGVAENLKDREYTYIIEDGLDQYSCNVSVKKFSNKIKTARIGQSISNSDLSFTINDIYYTTLVSPSKASGYYHYYEAESGKVFLVVKATAKNQKGTNLSMDSIAGVSCVYNGKYNYTSFCAFEEEGGSDLNDHTSIYALGPLDSTILYYIIEAPSEIQYGSVEVSIYCGGDYYKYNK